MVVIRINHNEISPGSAGLRSGGEIMIILSSRPGTDGLWDECDGE